MIRQILIPVVVSISAALAFVQNAQAATRATISITIDGRQPRSRTGTLTVDGERWRLDYNVPADEVTDITSIIHTTQGELIALNQANHTWFRLKSHDRLAITSDLFFFGIAPNEASKIKIANAGVDENADHTSRIQHYTFSYQINTKVAGENLRGDVSGQIRLWINNRSADQALLPWKPFDLRSGLAAFDEQLRPIVSETKGSVWKAEVDVSRKLEGGTALTEHIRRSIDDVSAATIRPDAFDTPPGYTYQEPIIGGP
jgi:hypothetical protein